jgi:type IV pilus assembly protein PilM
VDVNDAMSIAASLPPVISQIMRETGIHPAPLVVSLGGQMVFPRFAKFPAVGDKAKLEQLVHYEIEQNVPFPIDEIVSDHQFLGTAPDGDMAAMIVAAKLDGVRAVTDAVAAAGLKAAVVDVSPLAVLNALHFAQPQLTGCSVVLDIGSKTTNLILIEGEKIYNRAIPVAGNTITKEIAQVLGCTTEEAEAYKCQNAYVSMGGVTEDEDETLDAVAKVCRSVMTRLHAEITRSINFYRSQQGGSTPARLYLTGGTTLMPQLGEFFQDSLQIDVGYLNAFDAVSVAPGVDQTNLEYDSVFLAATTGVALHCAGKAAIDINLLPPSITEALKEAARIPFVAAGAASLVAASLIMFFAQSGELESLTAEDAEVTARLSELQASENYNRKAEEALASEKAAATELARRIYRHDAYQRKIETVRSVLGSDLWIAKWEEKTVKEKVEEPKPNNRNRRGRSRAKVEEVSEKKVTSVVLRGWKDAVEAMVGGDNTIASLLTERLVKTGAFVDGGVEIVGTPTRGLEGCLQEVELNLRFKEPEWK